MSWKARAACKGRTDLDWFAFGHDTVEVCRGCPVRMDCLSEGLWDEETPGTWGMTSEAQRRRVRTGKATVEQVWAENAQGVLPLAEDEGLAGRSSEEEQPVTDIDEFAALREFTRRKQKAQQDWENEVIRLRTSGWSTRAVAVPAGVSHMTVGGLTR